MDKKIAHLYSGGTDSTYAAVIASQLFDTVHLLTFYRKGLSCVRNSEYYVSKLRAVLGTSKFQHYFFNIDKEFRAVCYNEHLQRLLKYGFYSLLNCALCKLAMHWRTIKYCVDNGIRYVSDGSCIEMTYLDPSQNIKVIEKMRLLYFKFGIKYFTPSFKVPVGNRENELFRLGISGIPRIKGTPAAALLEPVCSQEYLHILALKYFWQSSKMYLNFDTPPPEYEKYERKMLVFHGKVRDFICRSLEKYLISKK